MNSLSLPRGLYNSLHKPHNMQRLTISSQHPFSLQWVNRKLKQEKNFHKAEVAKQYTKITKQQKVYQEAENLVYTTLLLCWEVNNFEQNIIEWVLKGYRDMIILRTSYFIIKANAIAKWDERCAEIKVKWPIQYAWALQPNLVVSQKTHPLRCQQLTLVSYRNFGIN